MNRGKVLVLAGALLGLSGCASESGRVARAQRAPLAGMPPVTDARNIYSETTPRNLSPVVQDHPRLVYVPLAQGNAVMVIDQRTFKVVRRFRAGKEPQHATGSMQAGTPRRCT